MQASALVAIPLLIAARYAKGPRQAWFAVVGTLGLTALVAPSFLALAGLLGAVTFALHTARRATLEPIASLVGGTRPCAYMAVWTMGWSGGPLPAHHLWLEVPYTALAVALAWKGRAWGALVPALVNLGTSPSAHASSPRP